MFLLGLSLFISLKGDFNYTLGFLGASNFRGGQELAEENYLSLFLCLGVVLLLILLVVVRASGAGRILVRK